MAVKLSERSFDFAKRLVKERHVVLDVMDEWSEHHSRAVLRTSSHPGAAVSRRARQATRCLVLMAATVGRGYRNLVIWDRGHVPWEKARVARAILVRCHLIRS
jgi:hypothetical protein